jgi:alpha-L-fucosidase
MKKIILISCVIYTTSLVYSQKHGIFITSEQTQNQVEEQVSGEAGQLKNPSFEDGLEHYNVEVYGGELHVEIASEEAHEGSRALKISGKKDGLGAITQKINVEQNTVYYYSFFVKSDITGTSKLEFFIDGNTIDFMNMVSEPFYFEDDEWIIKEFYFNTGETSIISLQIKHGNVPHEKEGGIPGTVYIDDFNLEKKAVTEGEYVINESRRVIPGVTLEMNKRNLNEWFGTMKGGTPQKFLPTVESLRQYECPEWFRDAKFGIYMHWGVYSVPEMGAWFARHMYLPGMPENKYMKEKFGNITEYGYKDLIPLWKAEKFDPDSLLSIFKNAGAKYFTPVAVHHDNFDLWDSRYHKWNAVNMGPKKDIIGMFREATLKAGLRWGVTTHLARSWSWYNVNKLSDADGPYDGNLPEYQDYYFKNTGEIGHTIPVNADAQWRFEWACRVMDLINQHQPDLLYFDGSIPFRGVDQGFTGMNVLAYYYNENSNWHGGKSEAVMCIKKARNGYYIEGVATLDIERGHSPITLSEPWQTDDALGPWSYNPDWPYMSLNDVIDKMVDIVSKNGNYLLNVAPKADGTLDDETISILEGIGKWLNVNGSAIYSTRPWDVAKEGDVRFTQSKDGRELYITALELPGDGKFQIKALSSQKKKVRSVKMHGHSKNLKWKQTIEGLEIIMPKSLPCDYAWSFMVEVD